MKMSRLEAGVRIALRYYEAYNRHNPAEMAGLLDEAFVFETAVPAPDGEKLIGRESIIPYWQDHFAQHQDARLDVEEVFGFRFRVVTRWRVDWHDEHGTAHHLRGVDVLRVQDKAITEIYSYVKG